MLNRKHTSDGSGDSVGDGTGNGANNDWVGGGGGHG